MSDAFKCLTAVPVVAMVRSNNLTMAVLTDPLYLVLFPLTILSAQILPCLFAGPAR